MNRLHIFLYDFTSSKSNRAVSLTCCACLNMFQSSSLSLSLSLSFCSLFSRISLPSPSRSICTLHLPSQLLSVCESLQGTLPYISHTHTHTHSNALTLAPYNCLSFPPSMCCLQLTSASPLAPAHSLVSCGAVPSRIVLPLGERQPDSWVGGWVRHDPWREDVNKELPVAGPLTKHRPKTQIAGVVMTTTVGHRSFAGKKTRRNRIQKCEQ